MIFYCSFGSTEPGWNTLYAMLPSDHSASGRSSCKRIKYKGGTWSENISDNRDIFYIYICEVKQRRKNSSPCRPSPGFVEGARGSESGDLWMDRSHMGNGKLPAPPQIFSVFYHRKHCVPEKIRSSLLGTTASLSSFPTSFAIWAPLLHTPTQLARYLWCGMGLGKDKEAKLQVKSGAAQHYSLFKWKPGTIRPLMCYNSFDYPHFWLSVNNVLNG